MATPFYSVFPLELLELLAEGQGRIQGHGQGPCGPDCQLFHSNQHQKSHQHTPPNHATKKPELAAGSAVPSAIPVEKKFVDGALRLNSLTKFRIDTKNWHLEQGIDIELPGAIVRILDEEYCIGSLYRDQELRSFVIEKGATIKKINHPPMITQTPFRVYSVAGEQVTFLADTTVRRVHRVAGRWNQSAVPVKILSGTVAKIVDPKDILPKIVAPLTPPPAPTPAAPIGAIKVQEDFIGQSSTDKGKAHEEEVNEIIKKGINTKP